MQQKFSQGLMIGLGVAFIVVPSLFVGLRFWARRLSRRPLMLHDMLCVAALGIGITCSGLQLYAAIDGQLGSHQVVGADGQPLLDDERFLVYEKTKFAVNILSVVGLGLVKSSILFFYKSVLGTSPRFRHATHAMLGAVAAWTVAFTLANLFTCHPVTPLIEGFYHNDCIDTIPMWLSVVITDLIMDVAILFMPVPMVLRLHLPLRQRIGVLAIFMLGATVCGASGTRLATWIEVANEFESHFNDETYYTSPIFYWTNIELAMAVVAACLPTLRPIWIHCRPSSRLATSPRHLAASPKTEESQETIPSPQRHNEWIMLR